MTNRIAFSLAALVAFLIGVDLWVGWGGTLFMIRKLLELINALIFWR